MTHINKNQSQTGAGQKNQMHQTKLLSPASHAQSKQEILRTEEAAKKWISTGVVFAAVVILVGWMIAKNNTPSSVVGGADTQKDEKSMPTPVMSELALSVSNQAAGSNISIANMKLSDVTWVAIRDPKAMRILGARRFEASETSGEVILLRATTAGTAYEAVLYKDDGDRAFDHKKDTLIEGVASSFTAQ